MPLILHYHKWRTYWGLPPALRAAAGRGRAVQGCAALPCCAPLPSVAPFPSLSSTVVSADAPAPQPHAARRRRARKKAPRRPSATMPARGRPALPFPALPPPRGAPFIRRCALLRSSFPALTALHSLQSLQPRPAPLSTAPIPTQPPAPKTHPTANHPHRRRAAQGPKKTLTPPVTTP